MVLGRETASLGAGSLRAGRTFVALAVSAALSGCAAGRQSAPFRRADPSPAGASATPPAAPAAETPPGATAPEPPVAPSAGPPFTLDDGRRVDEAVRARIDEGEIAGAVVAIILGGRVVFRKAYGARQVEPTPSPMTLDTAFDLASLTKPVATAASVMLLVERGLLRLGDPASRYVPGLRHGDHASITVEQLLLHASGLPADNPMRDYGSGRARALERMYARPLSSRPGARFVYSDLGYIVLGEIVERVSGKPLDQFAKENLFEPVGMRSTAFAPGEALAARSAPTGRAGDRWLRGEVHDPRARALGGVAGHAGLFSTADDLALFAQTLINGGERDGRRVFAEETIKAMSTPREVPGGRRALGWGVPSRGLDHTGFTGTYLWLDLARKSALVVLTSRLHPASREGRAQKAPRPAKPMSLRRELLNLVSPAADRPDGGAAAAPRAQIMAGIDALERDGFRLLAGRKVGLLTNASGVDRGGTSTAQLLASAPGVTLVALFSPEHGLAAGAEGRVDDERAGEGPPVYSLYGPRSRPTARQLAGIDTLVYDVQNVGARFYTFETTLGYLLETAAARGLRLVVLDRPNPIGGVAIEGPLLDAGRESFTGYHPTPVRHGMTAGELALMFNAERRLGADLHVVRVEGWGRSARFDRTGLPWVPPSPNMKTPETALLYPGVALLETTNVSVGRGTDRPFFVVGAPWVDASRLAEALASAGLRGVSFSPTQFSPTTGPYVRERCAGVEMAITDADQIEPVRVGLEIARQLRRLFGSRWRSGGLTTLLGNGRAFEAFERGDTTDAIVASYQADLKAFASRREPFLLYR